MKKTKYVNIYLSFGSNIGDRQKNIEKAFEKLKQKNIRLIKKSSYYKTSPVGPSQRFFYNSAAKFRTSFTPKDLLMILKKIEEDLGRIKNIKWGPRIIDIDILFYSDKIIRQKNIIIPHKEIKNRLFVLYPLAEIAPSLTHPNYKKQIKTLLNKALTESSDFIKKL